MDDRGRMQTPGVASQGERSELTAEQQDEFNSLMRLAQIQMELIGEESSAENITYVLSLGPKNVVQLVETVPQIDPGYEVALELRQQVFDVYLAKARELENAEDYQQAMALTRNAEAVIPATGTVLRLQRGRFRAGSSAARALDLLIKMPVMTVKLLADRFNVSMQAANQGLIRLRKAGVIRDRSGKGRGRIYAAEEVIGVLARPFGVDPEIALESARDTLAIKANGQS